MLPRPPLPLSLAAAALLAGASGGAPASAQMLLDAAAAGSVQGALQQQGSAGYGQTLDQVRSSLASSSATATTSPAVSGPAGPTSAPIALPPPSGGGGGGEAAPAATTSFVINNRPVPFCSSGLPCLGSIRRALGLRP
ncbi:MAG: hypothetical protein VKJ66_09830 [Synechococcus sp.]|nr:hypothetical protein [Synechococcus sp.]